MKLYKLNKDILGHKKEDVLYQKDNNFHQWVNEPKFMIESIGIISNDFEPFEVEYENDEQIYYLSPDGSIIEDSFYIGKHYPLVVFGNIFKSLEHITSFKNNVIEIINNESVLLNKTEIYHIIQYISTISYSTEKEKIIEILNKYI